MYTHTHVYIGDSRLPGRPAGREPPVAAARRDR